LLARQKPRLAIHIAAVLHGQAAARVGTLLIRIHISLNFAFGGVALTDCAEQNDIRPA